MHEPPAGNGGILTDDARALIAEERAVLGRLRELLAAEHAAEDDLAHVRQAELDLDEVFLLVVVGEFNSGKSAFINALAGERIMREGVTPTTAAITRLRYGPAASEHRNGALLDVYHPMPLLRDVAIVDTPGTNAVLREHEELTSRFVPRADLVLFVTSADRPFTETERAFMERIRSWGKKIVVVLNKADLLASERDVQDQVQFVRQSVERLLGFAPEVFPVSARAALAAKEEADPARRAELWEQSRFGPLEALIVDTLEESSRLAIKLSTPIGVADRTIRTYRMAADERLALLDEDLRLAESIESEIRLYREDMRRDVAYRLEGVDNILHELEDRGTTYLDDTLRISHVVDLFRERRVREEFERVVVGDTAERIDRAAQSLIDWMVDQDARLWRGVIEQVERRRRAPVAGGPADRLSGTFEYDRREHLGSLGHTAREMVARHNHAREAAQIAQSVRDAVTQATLLEAGAIGLGAISMAIAGSAAADVTGLFAASVLAGLGLWVLPRKRAQAKRQFRERTDALRTRLLSALKDEFERELERGVQRIRDALAPYDRFVRGEHERTERFRSSLEELQRETSQLAGRVERLNKAER